MAEIIREPEYVSNQIADFGPVLTDEEFFEEIDTSIPELCAAAEAYRAGDKTKAYRGFADFVKSILRPEIFFSYGGRVLKPVFDDYLKTKAGYAMNHYFESVGIYMQFGKEIDWLANPTPNNYSEWRIHLQYHNELVTLSKAYRATGEEKYAEEMMSLWLHWIKNVPRCEYTSGSYGPTQTWRTLECGIRCNGWMEMLHSVINSPCFTDEACVTVFKSFYEHQMRISSGYTHGNWLYTELHGMSTVTVVTPVFKKSVQWRNDVANRLLSAMEAMVYPDGWQYELAPGYMGVCMDCSRAVEQSFRAYGLSMSDKFYGIIDNMINCYIKSTMANGQIPPINDSGAGYCSSFIKNTVAVYGASDAAKWMITGGKEGAAPEYNSVLMSYAGFTALRTGWGEGNISAFFDAGKYGRDHFHDDKLNLLVYNDKKAVIAECGTYAYDMSMMRNYCVNTEGHNTVMVDGFGQCRFEGHWQDGSHWAHTEEDVVLYESEQFDYTRGYYDENYGVCDYSKLQRTPVPGRPLARHMREVIMMKRPKTGAPYFIAVDNMTDKIGESHTYEALWHINGEEAVITGDRVVSEDVTLFTYGFDDMVCYKGSTDPHQGWLARSSNQDDYYAAPAIVARAHGKDVSFVTLIALGAECEIAVASVKLCGDSVVVTYKSGEVDTVDLAALRAESKR